MHIVPKHRARRMQRPDGFAEGTEHHAAGRMDVANRLDIGPGFINARMNPEFRIGPAAAGKLPAVDVEG